MMIMKNLLCAENIMYVQEMVDDKYALTGWDDSMIVYTLYFNLLGGL